MPPGHHFKAHAHCFHRNIGFIKLVVQRSGRSYGGAYSEALAAAGKSTGDQRYGGHGGANSEARGDLVQHATREEGGTVLTKQVINIRTGGVYRYIYIYIDYLLF